MRLADINVGEEYAWMRLGVPQKVKVLTKGTRGSGFGSTQRHDGVRVRVVAGGEVGATKRLTSRDLAPWTEEHQRSFERFQHHSDLEARLHRIATRLGITVSVYSRSRGATVNVFSDEFIELAARLGVETD